MDKNAFIVCLGVALIVGVTLGMVAGTTIATNNLRQVGLDRELAYYNTKTGEFTWKNLKVKEKK